MENIGKTVTDGFERESEKERSAEPRSGLARFFDGLVQVAGFIIKFVLVLLAICCIPALVVGLIVAFALLMAATGILASAPAILYYALPEIDWSLLSTAPRIGHQYVGMCLAGGRHSHLGLPSAASSKL